MPPYNRKPRTGIMLCYPFEERRILGQMNARYTWSWPVAVQPKLDGERCRFYFEPAGGTWMGLSAAEEPAGQAVPHIVKALNNSSIPKSVELDGELYCHGLTQDEIHSIASRRRNLHPDHEALTFHVFDVVDTTTPQIERLQMLKFVSRKFPEEVILVETQIVHEMEDIYHIIRERIGQDYEGIIVRDLQGVYRRKRSSWIMKWKPKKRDKYLIVGANQLVDQEGNTREELGSFTCITDGNEFNCGTGMLKKEREAYWQEYLKDPYVFDGLYLLVEYQNITKYGVPRGGGVYKGILVEGGEE